MRAGLYIFLFVLGRALAHGDRVKLLYILSKRSADVLGWEPCIHGLTTVYPRFPEFRVGRRCSHSHFLTRLRLDRFATGVDWAKPCPNGEQIHASERSKYVAERNTTIQPCQTQTVWVSRRFSSDPETSRALDLMSLHSCRHAYSASSGDGCSCRWASCQRAERLKI
jgi:hypothetical protein